ncbi:MAG TPA: MGMT family protein [Alphaproteobacteria bacterium]
MSFTGLTNEQYDALKDYPQIIYGLAETDLGPLAVAFWSHKTEDKICYLGLKARELSVIAALQKIFPRNTLKRDDKRATSFAKAYFTKSGKTKDWPLLLKGTEFFIAMWRVVAKLPSGKTMTYKELAAKAGRPLAIRAAGQAMATNPVALLIPCHRVLGSSNGGLGGYGYGLEFKRNLLAAEKT